MNIALTQETLDLLKGVNEAARFECDILCAGMEAIQPKGMCVSLIAISKDSFALLDILMTLRERAPIHFDFVAVNLDEKQPNFPADILPVYLTGLGVPFHIVNQDTDSIVKRLIPEGKTTCYAEVKQFPIIPCDLCGSQENLQRRQVRA